MMTKIHKSININELSNKHIKKYATRTTCTVIMTMKYNQKKNQDYTRTTIIVALLKDLGEVVDLGINSKMVNGLQGSVKILM